MGKPLSITTAPRLRYAVSSGLLRQDAHQDDTREQRDQIASDDLSEEEARGPNCVSRTAAPVNCFARLLRRHGTCNGREKNLGVHAFDNETETVYQVNLCASAPRKFPNGET